MPALICGSLAFDTITNFHGRFAQQILPEQVHILNVSFLVPTLRREYGGCAGNIAYNLKLIGGEPVVLAAIGSDGHDYLARMDSLDIDRSSVRVEAEHYTAQAIIITDADNNQITAFHPGAMAQSHLSPVPARRDLAIGIIAPDGREAMLAHAEQFHAACVPFIFDPGQQLPMFDGAELRHFVEQSSWVALNDYEARMLCERLDTTLESLSLDPSLRGIVVTLAAEGCDVWQQGQVTRIGGVAASEILDPTGCGDAFRAGLLYGLERGWALERCAALGNRLGALKISCRGAQNHRIESSILSE
jgi:adenosine kinase